MDVRSTGGVGLERIYRGHSKSDLLHVFAPGRGGSLCCFAVEYGEFFVGTLGSASTDSL